MNRRDSLLARPTTPTAMPAGTPRMTSRGCAFSHSTRKANRSLSSNGSASRTMRPIRWHFDVRTAAAGACSSRSTEVTFDSMP